MPQLLIHGNHSRHRGETVCKKLATLTVRNLIFSRCQIWSIFTVFRYFSIFFDRFRSFSIVYTPGSVRKRSELFEAKIRGRMGVERAVLMCATRQYLSLPRETLDTKFDGQQLGSSGAGGRRTTTDTQQIRKSQIPMSRSVRSVLELSDHSGPSIHGEASQMSRNPTSLGL